MCVVAVTCARRRPGTLVVVTVIEVIYVVAATLWILVVAAALSVGIRCAVKLHRRRRRLNRLIEDVLLRLGIGGAAVSAAGRTAVVLQRLLREHGRDLPTARPGGRRWRIT